MIEQFTQKEFETELETICFVYHLDWKSRVFFSLNEYVYGIPVHGDIYIRIHSSINPYRGIADGIGQNSIRIYLWDNLFHVPVMGKLHRWITRVPGWQGRMEETIKTLIQYAKQIEFCDECKSYEHIYKVKKEGPNKGKLFKKCKCEHSFEWVNLDNFEDELGEQ